MDTLPADVLGIIVGFVAEDSASITVLPLVCKAFHRSATSFCKPRWMSRYLPRSTIVRINCVWLAKYYWSIGKFDETMPHVIMDYHVYEFGSAEIAIWWNSVSPMRDNFRWQVERRFPGIEWKKED